MGIFTGIALQAQPAGTSRDSSEKSFRFALHSSRYADCSHEERAIDSHTMRYSIYVLNAFGREAFQRTPPREGAPRAGACSLFRCSMLSISLCIKKRFFSLQLYREVSACVCLPLVPGQALPFATRRR